MERRVPRLLDTYSCHQHTISRSSSYLLHTITLIFNSRSFYYPNYSTHSLLKKSPSCSHLRLPLNQLEPMGSTFRRLYTSPLPNPTILKSFVTLGIHMIRNDALADDSYGVILIPFIVIAFTVYGGYPTSLMRKSTPIFKWYGLDSHQSKWKREPKPQSIVSSSSTLSASPTSTSSSSVPVESQILPTVPTSPPVLPTPFPQAFDGIITQNFSTSSCLNFFNNMTSSMDFRSCRPFSFLSSTSSTFINVSFSFSITHRPYFLYI